MKPFLLILPLLACSTALHAQQQAPVPAQTQAQPATMQNMSQMTADDYLRMELPPLGVLIDNARQGSQMQYYGTLIDEAKSSLKSEKRGWLKYFRGTAGYQYGEMNYLTSAYTGAEGDPTLPYPYTGKKQSYWNVGGALSIPLNDLFDRRNMVKRQKLAVTAAEQDFDRTHDELSLRIIDAYTMALQNLALIQSQAQAVILAAAQYKISESDFMNGKIDAVVLSRQKNIESVSIREYEQTRAALNNALLKLEVLSHTKIITQ